MLPMQIVPCVEAHQNKVVSYQPNCCVEWIQCSWHPTTSSSSAYCWPPIMSLRATTSKILQLIIMYCSPTDAYWYLHYSVTGIRINPILGKEFCDHRSNVHWCQNWEGYTTQHAKYSNTPSVLWSFKLCATSQPLDFLMSKLISLSARHHRCSHPSKTCSLWGQNVFGSFPLLCFSKHVGNVRQCSKRRVQ